MKSFLFVSLVSGLLLVGCGDGSTKSGSAGGESSGGSLVTAPVDYLNTAANAQHKAVKEVDTVAIKSAIDMFNVQEGRYPKDLNELVAKQYIPKIPEVPYGMKIDYDAVAGAVKIVKQ